MLVVGLFVDDLVLLIALFAVWCLVWGCLVAVAWCVLIVLVGYVGVLCLIVDYVKFAFGVELWGVGLFIVFIYCWFVCDFACRLV